MKISQTLFPKLLILCSLLLVAVDTAGSVEFDFTVIADTDTPIPNGIGNFISFGNPAIVSGSIAFHAEGVGSRKSIYLLKKKLWIKPETVRLSSI